MGLMKNVVLHYYDLIAAGLSAVEARAYIIQEYNVDINDYLSGVQHG